MEGVGKCAGNWHGSRRVVVNLRCAANEPKQCENIETGRETEREREDAVQQSNKRIELPIIQFNNGTGYSLP